ncbi:MAG: lysophospholipid acyltransferase family protein [Fusobacterium sp.]|nr:lysophospholipid acyltransferase family protein [Fusobacterium sp.]
MYLIQYLLCRFFIFILLLFPEKLRFSFGNFLGNLTYKLIKKRREIAILNLKMAFPEKNIKEIENLAKKSFQIMIKAFLCVLWFEKYLNNKKNIKIINQENIESLLARNKGLVVATIHMGNMESTLKAAENYEIVTVAKKQRNPYINDFMNKLRAKYSNVKIIEKSRNTSRELLEEINEKKIIALFSDHRDSGSIVHFFNKDAKAPTGAVSLALKHDIPLILVYNVMNDDNTTTIYVSDEIILDRTDNFKEDVNKNTQTLISEIEKIITKYPEQWMWFHDRWNIHSSLRKLKKK